MGLSKQSWNLVKKIREVDSYIKKKNETIIFESHPEIIFQTMKRGEVHSKKKNEDGIIERKNLLEKKTVNNVLKINTNKSIRLVRGSHIITKKLYDEDIAFTLQNDDNRIVFVIPYKEEFSLIGTTEVDVNTPDNPSISDDEKIYLINSINLSLIHI